jgi:hypothetical protein
MLDINTNSMYTPRSNGRWVVSTLRRFLVLSSEVIDLIPENGDLIGDACTRLKQIESLLKTGHADERLFWKES